MRCAWAYSHKQARPAPSEATAVHRQGICDAGPWSGRRSVSQAGPMTIGRKIAAATGMAAVVYGLWMRPRLMRWGATDEEVQGPYPGKEVVPEGRRSSTMAVTIEAPPAQVWPWLVQLGWDRGGWYSWTASITVVAPVPEKCTWSGRTWPSATS